MLRLKCDHTIFDPELRPPLFQHNGPSYFAPINPIPVAVQIKDASNTSNSASKRKRMNDATDDEKQSKRIKSGHRK
jgi:hypothetical protein